MEGRKSRTKERAHYSHLFHKRRAQIGNKRRGSMAVFHIKASFGSRAGGQSARAKSDYIEREGRYEQDSEELEYKEHGNMPEWAEDDPGSYWEAADKYERSNGRLYSEIQFALPKELDEAERLELAVEFAERVCSKERLPYTLAIHRGGANGENPHAHLMFSERGHDGIERDAEQWFRRYNRKAPEKGGARKSRAAKAGDWLEKTRKAWEQTANRALERAGRAERIDGRSLADLRDEAHRAGDLERAADFSREPNVHLGPERYRTIRGGASETVQQAGRVERRNRAGEHEREADRKQVERLEREIAGVEARLKETYDRVRTAIDQRIRQARRAIREGAEAAARAGRAVGRAGEAIGRAARGRSGAVYRVEQNLGGARDSLAGASADIGQSARGRTEGVRRVERAHGRAARTLERTCREIDLGIQRAGEAIGREVKKIKFTRERGLPERGLAKRWRERSRGWER